MNNSNQQANETSATATNNQNSPQLQHQHLKQQQHQNFHDNNERQQSPSNKFIEIPVVHIPTTSSTTSNTNQASPHQQNQHPVHHHHHLPRTNFPNQLDEPTSLFSDFGRSPNRSIFQRDPISLLSDTDDFFNDRAFDQPFFSHHDPFSRVDPHHHHSHHHQQPHLPHQHQHQHQYNQSPKQQQQQQQQKQQQQSSSGIQLPFTYISASPPPYPPPAPPASEEQPIETRPQKTPTPPPAPNTQPARQVTPPPAPQQTQHQPQPEPQQQTQQSTINQSNPRVERPETYAEIFAKLTKPQPQPQKPIKVPIKTESPNRNTPSPARRTPSPKKDPNPGSMGSTFSSAKTSGQQPFNKQSSNFASAAAEAANLKQPAKVVKSPQEKLDEILTKIEEIEKDVYAFSGKKGDKEYRKLDEFLVRCLLQLDEIERGDDNINQQRRKLIHRTQAVCDKLEAKGEGRDIAPAENVMETSTSSAASNYDNQPMETVEQSGTTQKSDETTSN